MTGRRWALLLIVIATGAAFVTMLFTHEAGRQRLLPILRPLLKRVINPRVLRAVERGDSTWAIVHHTGRRSGTVYHTPVDAHRTEAGVLVLLPYGPITDWCRNVLAAGRCTLTLAGEELSLSAPVVIPASAGETQVAADVARSWRRQGIARLLALEIEQPVMHVENGE